MSYDDLALLHGMNPNNYNFIKHVKLISSIPMHYIGEIPTSDELFLVSKKGPSYKLFTSLGKSNNTVSMYLRSEPKVLPMKQQQKW